MGRPPGALLGAGLAGLAPPDVQGRGRRRGRVAARLAFLPLSGEAPRTAARDRRGGTESGSPAGRARLGRRVRGEAGGGAGHTWPRSRDTCCVRQPRGLVGGLKAPASAPVRTSRARRTPTPWQEPFRLSVHLTRAPIRDLAGGRGSAEGRRAAQRGRDLRRSRGSRSLDDLRGESLHLPLTLLPGRFCYAGVWSFSPVEFTALAFYGTQNLHYFGMIQVF